jgi:hypothetical protein
MKTKYVKFVLTAITMFRVQITMGKIGFCLSIFCKKSKSLPQYKYGGTWKANDTKTFSVPLYLNKSSIVSHFSQTKLYTNFFILITICHSNASATRRYVDSLFIEE